MYICKSGLLCSCSRGLGLGLCQVLWVYVNCSLRYINKTELNEIRLLCFRMSLGDKLLDCINVILNLKHHNCNCNIGKDFKAKILLIKCIILGQVSRLHPTAIFPVNLRGSVILCFVKWKTATRGHCSTSVASAWLGVMISELVVLSSLLSVIPFNRIHPFSLFSDYFPAYLFFYLFKSVWFPLLICLSYRRLLSLAWKYYSITVADRIHLVNILGL